MEQNKKPLIVIVGPTAVGKTALSIDLAKAFDAEVISGDSMQVYRGMDIGTAKITPEEAQGVPHHLIDILAPDEPFNALTFKNSAQSKINEILSRGHLPMVVGGTGLYVNGLIYDYDFQGERDDAFRQRIYEEMVQDSEKARSHFDHVITLRPDLKGILFERDYFRISRALEIIRTEGKDAVMDFDMKRNYVSPYDLCLIGLNMDRAKLYDRINRRVDIMIENGLVEEVEKLLQQGYNKKMQALKAIGYKEIIDHLEGRLSLEESVELLKKNTRHFAKRQLTWFRRDPNIRWFDVDRLSYEALFDQVCSTISACLKL